MTVQLIISNKMKTGAKGVRINKKNKLSKKSKETSNSFQKASVILALFFLKEDGSEKSKANNSLLEPFYSPSLAVSSSCAT